MTKTLKITSIIFAFIAAIGMLLLFSGCKKAISQKEGFKAMATAADNYTATRVNYENFKDSTFTYSVFEGGSAQEEIEYKEHATDTNTVKKTFTQTGSNSIDTTIVLQNVTNTVGNEQVKDIHMSFKLVVVEQATNYSLNNDQTLKEEKTNTKTTSEYILGTKVANGDVEYFVTMSERVEEEGKNDEVTQKYYNYADREDYIESFAGYLGAINEIVLGSFFSLNEMIDHEMAILSLLNTTKDGNVIELSLSGSKPEIDYYGNSGVSTTDVKVSFKGGNIYKSSQVMTMETSKSIGKVNTEIGFQDSATNVTVPGLNHYTETDEEIIVPFLVA